MKFERSARENGKLILSPGTGHETLPHQIVTLAFLSEQISAPFLSEQLARSLCAETDASVVLVRLEPPNGDDGTRPELFLNGEFHMPSELRQTDGGFHSITLGVRSEPPTPAGIDSLVSQLSSHFQYVLIETPADQRPVPWFSELLLRSHLAYLFFKTTAEDVSRLDLILREARTQGHGDCAHIKPIVVLAEDETIGDFDLLAQRAACPVHLSVHACPTRESLQQTTLQFRISNLFRADVRRLAREICGRLVGLALSSGAAKGFAHIGVLQVLEENGIEVDVVAGASMGAYVGSLWAHGCDGRELERLARELEKRWALWTLIDPAFPPRRGFIRGFAVKKRLMRTIGESHFADLVRPLRIVAANLATLERKVFSSGEVAAAVHASTAVPGICVPIDIDGEIYTDGGIVDPLPVDVLHEMGVNKVIAVNVIPTPERIRLGIEEELKLVRQNGTTGRGLFRKAVPSDQHVNYFARGNLLEILMRSVHGAQIRMAEASCQLADLVLRPDIFDDRWLDYRSPGRFIRLGREVTERHLAEIRSLVARKETIHEQHSASEAVATTA